MSSFSAGVNTNCGQAVYNLGDLVIYFFEIGSQNVFRKLDPMLKEVGAGHDWTKMISGRRQI
jgi:hypothetical protein